MSLPCQRRWRSARVCSNRRETCWCIRPSRPDGWSRKRPPGCMRRLAWCQQRFPHSPVAYVVADVLDPPSAWQGGFDFILEAYTLQVLPADVRSKATACIAGLLAKEGTLLVICRGRSPQEHPGTMPWPLTKEDVDGFKSAGLQQVQFEDYFDQEEPPKRRFRVEYQQASIR